MTIRLLRSCSTLALGVAIGLAAGCDQPVQPDGLSGARVRTTTKLTPPPTPTPPPSGGPAQYHLSGLVTDDTGGPLANIQVYLAVLVSDATAAHFDHPTTRTDATGAYRLDFSAAPSLYAGTSHPEGLKDIVAFASVWDDTGEHDGDFQYVTSATSTVSKNFRLSQFKRVAAGASVAVAIAPGDPICSNNTQDLHPWGTEWICQLVHVVIPADGTLVVTATPTDAGAQAQLLEPEAGIFGTGSVATVVRAGTEVVICIEVPFPAASSRSFAVATAIHAP